MEFSGINNRLDRRRIDSIVTGAQGDARCRGRRPRSRTSGRACGRSPPTGCRSSTAPGAFDNTYIATGYAMQGVTLAPTSGRALAEMIATGKRPPLLEPFRLDRFGRIRLPLVARLRKPVGAA